MFNGKPLIMKWYAPKPVHTESSPTLPPMVVTDKPNNNDLVQCSSHVYGEPYLLFFPPLSRMFLTVLRLPYRLRLLLVPSCLSLIQLPSTWQRTATMTRKTVALGNDECPLMIESKLLSNVIYCSVMYLLALLVLVPYTCCIYSLFTRKIHYSVTLRMQVNIALNSGIENAV